MTTTDWAALDASLTAALHPSAPPLAITFSASPPEGVPSFDDPTLSRVRTGMPSTETTCAIPASRLGEVVKRIESTAVADAAVAGYAAEDARRFA